MMRVLSRLMVTGAVAGGSIALLAAPAFAGSGVSVLPVPLAAPSPDRVTVDGSSSAVTISHSEQVALAGRAEPTCDLILGSGAPRSVSLSLAGPTGNRTLTSTSAGCKHPVSLASSVDTSSTRNGHYTLTLSNGHRSTATGFDLRVPPVQPSGLTAAATGTTVRLTWHANPEPDITGYDVRGAAGDLSPGGVAPGTACAGSSCSTTVGLPASAAGSRQSFSVHAVRCGASCSAADRLSGTATSTTVSVPTASRASGGGSGSGTGSPGSSSHGPGATTGARHSSAGHRSRSVSPVRGTTVADLGTPATASLAHLALPGLQTHLKSLPGGGDKPTLAGPAPAVPAVADQPPSAAHSLSHAIVSHGLQLTGLVRGIGAALVLLLLAAHLRRWSRTEEVYATG